MLHRNYITLPERVNQQHFQRSPEKSLWFRNTKTAQIWLSGHFIKILEVNIKACRLVVKRNRLRRNTHGTWSQLVHFMRNIALSLLHVGALPLWHCLHPRATALWISVRKWQHVLKRTASVSVTTNTPPHFISILLILSCLVPHTPTQTTHTIKLKENSPNHTFHKTWLLQLWAMKAQRRIRLEKVHAVITRHEICRKCLKNKGLLWKRRDQLNVTTVLDFGKLCLFSRGVENLKGSKSENKD